MKHYLCRIYINEDTDGCEIFTTLVGADSKEEARRIIADNLEEEYPEPVESLRVQMFEELTDEEAEDTGLDEW